MHYLKKCLQRAEDNTLRIHSAVRPHLAGSENWGPLCAGTPPGPCQGWDGTRGRRSRGRAGGAWRLSPGAFLPAFCLVVSAFPLVVDY